MSKWAVGAARILRPIVRLLTFAQGLVRIDTLRSCSRGDENVVHRGALWIRVGTAPGRCGFHPVPRPTGQRAIACPRDRTLRRTAITTESPSARTRILARRRTRSRVGSQASGPYSSRRTHDSLIERPWRREVGSNPGLRSRATARSDSLPSHRYWLG